ncbi:RsmE family RNA methyltransferase [Cryomorphaceae bacterium 1068]|nr:RsmE family RNA methyltransferase [Cryomorphaceae bacterium 1068]
MHFFLDPEFDPKHGFLNPEESKHAARVLRLREGDEVLIGDGKGVQYTAKISQISKLDVKVSVLEKKSYPKPLHRVTVAISPTKNLSRFEWFLEKATELGISEIVPLISKRTERARIKDERSEKIILNASKQSQRAFVPILRPMITFEELVRKDSNGGLIAHCISDKKRTPIEVNPEGSESLILIGPEGDFTLEEVELAEQAGFKGVVLNENRLRTETAGILAVAMLQMSSR